MLDGVCIINIKFYICYILDRFYGVSWKGSFCLGYLIFFIDIFIKNSELVNNVIEIVFVGVIFYDKLILVEIWKIKLMFKIVFF